jgi:hypothetical protein
MGGGGMTNHNSLFKALWARSGLEIALVLTLLGFQPQSSLAGPPGKPPKASDIAVITTISDSDAEHSYTVGSDGGGAYFDGVDNVISILTVNGYNGIPNGDWQFNKPVVKRKQRVNGRNMTISLNAADAVQIGDPHYTAPAIPPFWGTETVYAYAEVKCTFLNKSMLTMAANTTMTCPLLIDFFYGDPEVQYGLNPAHSFNNFPENTDAQITCESEDSGGCNAWSIDPYANPDPYGGRDPVEAVGRLVPHPDLTVNDGDFYMRFHIRVTRP